MKFTCNTKPLADALNIGVINANVSNYHKKSNIVQITCSKSDLVINLEAMNIRTELRLKGSGDSDESQTVFVSSLLLKQLVSTFDASTTTFEYVENGLILHSGRSMFTLPQLIQAGDLELDKPNSVDDTTNSIDINQDDWKFIKDNQMYAIAMSFIHPVYTRVWIGADGDVLVGDDNTSLFTHSQKSRFGSTCLLPDTIINLFISLPEGTKLCKNDRDYILSYKSDSFDYITQFTPLYEDDESVGSYSSDIFLDAMQHPDQFISVNAAVISKLLSQASLLCSSTDDSITLTVDKSSVTLKDKNVDCTVQVDNATGPCYSEEFNTETLRKVIANYGENVIKIAPALDGDTGETSGILLWDDNLTTILGGVEG